MLESINKTIHFFIKKVKTKSSSCHLTKQFFWPIQYIDANDGEVELRKLMQPNLIKNDKTNFKIQVIFIAFALRTVAYQ